MQPLRQSSPVTIASHMASSTGHLDEGLKADAAVSSRCQAILSQLGAKLAKRANEQE